MKTKPPVSRFFKAKAEAETAELIWHNGGDTEIHLYARSLQKAGQDTLLRSWNWIRTPELIGTCALLSFSTETPLNFT